jgi:hypothetical protein
VLIAGWNLAGRVKRATRAFRAVHGYERRELSWEWRRWPGGYRLDHLLVSGPCGVAMCRYVHAFREAGLSDHSALIAELHPGRSGEEASVSASSGRATTQYHPENPTRRGAADE